jgi:hypothetical protein
VGIVRHPDPQPCSACAVGEWDMCRNGGYTGAGPIGLLAALLAQQRGWRRALEPQPDDIKVVIDLAL